MAEGYEYKHYKNFPKGEWRWKNFTPRELRSKGDNKLKINYDAMDKLQLLRDMIGRPLVIVSAYRSVEHNKRVGGVKNSMHLQGRAFDVSMVDQDPLKFEALARKAGFTGFGFYQKHNFIHIDTGRPREWGARWWLHKQPDVVEVSKAEVDDTLKKDMKVGVAAGLFTAIASALLVLWGIMTDKIGGLF